MRRNIEQIYNSKKVSGEEAIGHIKSGQRVVLGHCSAEASYLVDLLVKNKENYENVEIVQMMPTGPMPLVDKGMEKHFQYNSLFVGNASRNAVAEGRAAYTPCFFSEIPDLVRKILPVDVALMHISKPNEDGYCSLGVCVDYLKAAAESAKMVIAQVNDNIPYSLGDCLIHISDIDYIVEHNCELNETPVLVPGEEELQIGKYCAELIHDGDTLQVGIGGIPNAVLASLHDKQDLGIHSEMMSDGIMELMEEGVINNSKKEINQGKTVVSFALGTRKLFDYMHNNPKIAMCPVDYVNSPLTIMQHKNLVSINSCIQIDLMGQVVSDTVGLKQISGVGGQVDFVRGANMAENGRSIIAMTSTAQGGKISKIVPQFEAGAAITLTRNEIDYVITEYGIASLKGRTLEERAKALIQIAHPKFRDWLLQEWKKKYQMHHHIQKSI